MDSTADRAVAIVGVGATLPDALSAPKYWQNICNKVYSITETPSDRWSIADYYDPDPSAPDKTYSKIGGWVRGYEFDWKRFRIPPRVAAAMDESQKWAVTTCAEALADFGYPDRPLDLERTGVVLGTAMGGELHYITTMRVMLPEVVHALDHVDEFGQLPANVREAIKQKWHAEMGSRMPEVTEDTMPGELANIVAGRVANVLNLRGPNFITDAACASTFAATVASVELLLRGQCDAILTGGVDRNMGISSFVKFCKIGALSATGTRPFGDGADGFIMGEGAACFLLKRLADAERDGDRIYGVIRGIGGSSDGKGKGITAPNPVGQVIAIQRAWHEAGLDPATATLIEAHGTSTKVGDVVEVESLAKVFGSGERGQMALGSAKSNIGHLKAGAGAAGLLKSVMSLHDKVLPPTLNAERPNPNIDFAATPFYINTELREWPKLSNVPRRAGVSAYGFGGTNFHLVLEEYVPGMLTTDRKQYTGATTQGPPNGTQSGVSSTTSHGYTSKTPIRGIAALGGATSTELKDKLDQLSERVRGGWTPVNRVPDQADLSAQERLVIDFGDHDELLERIEKARKAMGFDNPQAWKALQAQGVFRGSGPKPGKIAFLFPGQGSQYINMGYPLCEIEPLVAEIFAEADRVMTPILGKPLTEYIFVDSNDPAKMKQAELDLMQTAITQPAVLTIDAAIMKMLGSYGVAPDMVMGHSLGEYAALVAAEVMPFPYALEAAAARGSEMTKVSWEDNGWMAAVMAPLDVIMQTIDEVDGYVVAANINSYTQSVIGGESKAVEQAIARFVEKGFDARRIPVSHAFHTRIVAPASGPLRKVLDRTPIASPKIPIVANTNGAIYPTGIDDIKDVLEQQIASPVQWVKGLETLYAEGVRTFVEVGPKKALKGFVDNVLGDKADVVSLFTNHPKNGEIPTFNHALCGLYAAGYAVAEQPVVAPTHMSAPVETPLTATPPVQPIRATASVAMTNNHAPGSNIPGSSHPYAGNGNSAEAIGQALTQMLQNMTYTNGAPKTFDRNDVPQGSVVISGTGLGLPGAEKPVMDPDNALRILRGEQFIDLIPERFRKEILNKQITRLVKSEGGGGHFETLTDPNEVIKLAGRPGPFDLTEEYGVPDKLVEALDTTTQLAMAAGIDALREAGIPLVQTYRRTTTGKDLPERWLLPEALRDETGIIFASAFPGNDKLADEFNRYYTWQNRREQLAMLEDLSRYTQDFSTQQEINRRIGDLRETIEREPYTFDRRFIFRILAMGHSQFAEYIGARGPNTHVNAACAATAQAIALAEDWIRNGRCRRVLVVAADNVTSDNLLEWLGSGFLSTGAAATDDRVDEAALPFDRRRHGTILGMGACGLVVESEDAVRERGMRGIVELLSSETNNSAFHGTRLDVSHISQVMNNLVTAAERRFGIDRRTAAPQMVFVSHETFTPARGGSASAEVMALRETFGEVASQIVMSNTKGFTGHPMGVGIEDVIAVKILEHGIVPPVPNFKEVDPDLGKLNLSRGGRYPVQYALHLAAGFGSQISMTLTRRIPGSLDRFDNRQLYQHWLANVSGYDYAETEVVKRVLRIQAQGAPKRQPMPSVWQLGTGPTVRAYAPGDGMASVYQPAPMAFQPTPDVRPAPTPAPARAPVPTPVAVRAPEPTPAPVVAPAPAPTSAVPAAPTVDAVTQKVLEIVAAKTDYPPEMLDPELDLEADLGIDTVKQAETFAAIRDAFDIPRKDDLQLRSYPTLASVVGFVYSNRPDLKVAATPAPAAAPVTTPAPVATPAAPATAVADPVVDQVMAIVADKTGYPQEMLDLELDLEADLGIDTVKQAETFAAVREAFNIARQDDIQLRDYPTLASVVGFVRQSRPDLTAAPAPVATPVAVASVATPTPVAAAVPTSDPVTDQVMAIVADKTGYPQEMLDLELDLEADLGIDTVKQAETFAAVREAFNIVRQDDIQLRDYPTLASVVGFVRQNRPDLAVAPTPIATPVPAPVVAAPVAAYAAPSVAVATSMPVAPVATSAPANDPVTAKVLSIVADKTGYPEEMLDLDLDLEADLGVDTVKQAETFAAVREAFNIARQDDLQLRDYATLNSVIQFVFDNRPDLKTASPVVVASAVIPAATSTVPTGTDPVTAKVLSIVADKTGYPEEMLDLDLDLEADLGVDTVKQAETFAAVREAFNIARQDDLQLRDYATLNSVIQFVFDNRPDLKTATPVTGTAVQRELASATSAPAATSTTTTLKTVGTLEDADRIPRRVPVPSLRPSFDFCKPTGVTLDSNSRVVVMMDRGGVGKALLSRLDKRGVGTLVIEEPLSSDVIEGQLKTWLNEGPIQGVYWLPALDVEPMLEEMDLEIWRELNRQRVKNLYQTMRTLYDSISTAGTFLVSAVRLGGLHGYGSEGATAPLGGAVTGFTKAYKRERGDVLVKAVDFDISRKTADPADALIMETLVDPGVVEVGHHNGLRYGITLLEQPAADGQPGMTLDKNTVFVVSGAAGGITSSIVTDLAVASGGVFYLLDLADAPAPTDPKIVLFRTDKEALKRTLFEELKAAGERPTPVVIERQIMGIERSEAALRAIESVQAAGGTAHYHSVNLLDADAVKTAIDQVRKDYGRIDVLLHAGGLEISRSLSDKEAKEFNLVFDVKSDGFFNMLRAAQGMPIGATVSFSSVAGRFGNNGQTDYSSANDLLCKITSSLRTWRPETRGIVIDWTAWGGMGMATRGSIPRIMEMAGIDMLPPEAGVPTIRRELTYGGTRGELLVGQRLGILVEEFDADGGLDTAKVAAWLAERNQPLQMIGTVKSAKLYGGLEIETTFDPTEQPFLYDHQLDGTPLLPGVMGTESFAELAFVLANASGGTYHVATVENEQFASPFKFYRNQSRTLYLNATVKPMEGGDLVALTTLKSITQPRPEMPAREDVHFTASVRLTSTAVEASKKGKPPVWQEGPEVKVFESERIYQVYFHGPAYQVLERAQVSGNQAIGLMAENLPPNGKPAMAETLIAPRLIEFCFQTAGIWEMVTKNVMALPAGIESVTTYRQPESAEGRRLYAIVTAVNDGTSFDAQVVDEAGNVYVDMRGYLTVQLPGNVTL
ncbi:MAG: Malonyl CoA-acyl carrier protein transacylase [Chloroflexi bacterium AL-N15]|nr:Malonyl CoA-acyl carrier protein transacylase [Chloroflexi bacterium AL-N15]